MANEEDGLVMQLLDWDYFHEEDDEGMKKFCIRLFGKTKKQESVYLQVEEFKPYFFVEMRDHWTRMQADIIVETIKKKVKPEHSEGLKFYKIEEHNKFWGFTNYKKFKYLKLTFSDFDSMKAYEYAFKYPIKIPLVAKNAIFFKLFESNILPVLRFMHIKQLEAVGWIKVKKSDLEMFDLAPTCCQLNYKTVWTAVEPIEDRMIEKYTIAAFDIECTSGDGSFPQPHRDSDKVIQIGLTLSRFGEEECFYKHLLSLKQTADIEGVTVESFEKEEDLLLGFTKIIRKLDPDILIGYNIFGFDFNYLMERSKKLEIEHKFSRLSRINGELSEWKDASLSSAAIGVSIMKYYKMTGRVIIDLMKVVQRDYKLTSYKLDSVASTFIREKIIKVEKNTENNTFKISTKNTFGLYKDQYVVLVYAEGGTENKCNEGEKFKILELGKDFIVAKGNPDTTKLIGNDKAFWCQAKDDISPADIFRMCDGTPEDRAIIGKYCIQDCNLCNKLITKLQIVTNNVSMANVCNVPLSYLFFRGQGIKIFSLVAKKCREKNHVIPVIKKKEKKKPTAEDYKKINLDKKSDAQMEKTVYQLNNGGCGQEDDDDSDGYEGAIVFIPEPGVYFEPIPVLDFESLYPNAMRLRNYSHECFVNDPQYDNLPGYLYHTTTFKNNDETTKTCRFAESLDGRKGIIPEILSDLLTARKKYKKMMENEPDPFKRSILDSLQLAYKITANSLYGQTGASTSPICMKEIAASTTATGREMLLFSKYFIENMFAELINLALGDDKEKYLKRAKELYEYYPTHFRVDDVEIDEKTEKRTKIFHDIHVWSAEKAKIPEHLFARGGIGYEFKNEVFDEKTKTSILYGSFTDLFGEMGIKSTDEFMEKLINPLKSASVIDREGFMIDFKKLIVNDAMKKKKFFEKHESLLKTMGFDDENFSADFYKPLSKLSQDSKEKIHNSLWNYVFDLGYKNKDELFEKFYNIINCTLEGLKTRPEIIYGDTDSVFFKMNIVDVKTGAKLKNKSELVKCITLGIWASIMISSMLPAPMVQAYEKVLWPFIIQGKKRYVGNLYEKNPDKFSQKSMGIELKRRDNAPIVKAACSGIIDQILNKHSAEGAYKFIKETLQKIITGKYGLDKFIISKTLKGNALTKSERKIEEKKPKDQRSYANRSSIVHAVLADRMADRDPGNKPLSNDRIQYVYVEMKVEPKLQGDKVETPEYVVQNKLKVDYLFYITNQIMKPCLKFLDLIIEDAENIFREFIIKEENRKNCMMPIAYYATKSDKSSEKKSTHEFDHFDTMIGQSSTLSPKKVGSKSKSGSRKGDSGKIQKNDTGSDSDSDTDSDARKKSKSKSGSKYKSKSANLSPEIFCNFIKKKTEKQNISTKDLFD